MLLRCFCTFMILVVLAQTAGESGLSLMYCYFRFNYIYHIPFYLNSRRTIHRQNCSLSFWVFFWVLFLAFISIPSSPFPFDSSSLYSLLLPFPAFLPFNPSPRARLYICITVPESKETRQHPWNFRKRILLEEAPSYTREADVTEDIYCIVPWYGTVSAGVCPVQIMSDVFCFMCNFGTNFDTAIE